MAEFSKQYCDLHDMGFPHDFDIVEVADGLQPEHYTAIICEGFGFTAIAKDADGNILLAIPTGAETNDDGIEVTWKKYEEVVK